MNGRFRALRSFREWCCIRGHHGVLSTCSGVVDQVGAVESDERCGADDLGSLRELYPAVRRFAAVVSRPDLDCGDLVQEAFTRALVARGQEDIRDLGAYLRRTVVNLAKNGGDCTPISGSDVATMDPTWSPNGQIAYVSKRATQPGPEVRNNRANWRALYDARALDRERGR